MSNQPQRDLVDADAWPLPSPDVRRELEPPPLSWSEQEPDTEPVGPGVVS